MSISKKDIEHVAHLARLQISASESEHYREQLDSIVSYVDKLQDLDLDKVPEMQQANQSANVWREDEATPCATEERERALSNFPRREGDYLAVNAVFAEQQEDL